MVMRAVLASRNASVCCSTVVAVAALLTTASSFAAPGELDNTFGAAGRAQVTFGSTPENPVDARIYATAAQADGKLVLAGSVQRYLPNGDYNTHILVARLNANGTLDTTFDGDGWTGIDFGGANTYDSAYAVLVQPDGKIVVAGSTQSAQTADVDVALVRLNADGSLDAGFGTGGKVAFDAGGPTADVARGIVRRSSDGRLIIAGATDRNGEMDMLFAAFTSTGQLDTTFGTQGVTLVSYGPGSADSANALAQQTDGALVATGTGPGTSFVPSMAVVRLTSAGVPDTSFDGDGLAIVEFGSTQSEGTSLAIQSDGRIVVAGWAYLGAGTSAVLARLTTTGSPDTTFGGTGSVSHALVADWDYVTAAGVGVQSDGKIVIGGEGQSATNSNLARDLFIARYQADGSVDTSFGNQGVGIADFGTHLVKSSVTAAALLIQADGRIVVVGRDTNLTDGADIARFDSTGGGSFGVLSFLEPNSSYPENAGTVTIAVRRTGGSTGAASVNVRVGPGVGNISAGTGCDFTMGTLTLSWADGDYADKLVSVTIVDDAYVDYDYFSIELYGATGAVIAQDSHDVYIQSDGNDTQTPTTGEISIEPTKSVSEGAGSVTLTLTRTGGSQDCAVASFQTMDGSSAFPAIAGADYTAMSGVVQFNDGDTASKTISIPIINDTIGEADEHFGVQLNSGQLPLGNGYADVTILDNDGGFAGQIDVYGDAQDLESDGAAGGPITFTRSSGSNGAVSVHYTITSGTATAGTDFIATTGTVAWGAGDTSDKQIYVEILEDTLQEANETYLVTISNPTGGAILGSQTQATQTIYDNDTKYPGQLSCYTYTVPAHESVGKAFVVVTRNGGRDGAVTVDYATSGGTATSGADFTATSGTLTWQDKAGCTSAPTFTCTGNFQQFVEIPIIDDTTAEGDETFALTVSNPTGGATLGTPSSCDVTIYRNDSPNGAIGLLSTSINVGETAGTVTVSVTRTGGTQGVVTADYRTLGSTATPDVDFTSTSGTLTWANGEGGTKTVTVPILDDALTESAENFYVFIENLTGGAIPDYTSCYIAGNYCYAQVYIIDDESNPGTLVFANSLDIPENAGTASLHVSRTLGTTGAVSVAYATVPGTAQPPGDYTTTSGTLNWAAGEGGFKTISIPIVNDAVTESQESFTVHFSNPTGGVSLPNTDATLNIIDNDDPGDISMTLATVAVSETATTLNITASRTTGTTGEVHVDYATANGTATAGTDYTAASGTFIWTNGETGPKTISLTILDDTLEEPDETFAVNLSNPTGGARLQQASTIVTIQDNDANPGQLRFTASTRDVSESAATVQVDVERFGGSLGAVSVQYATSAGTASAGSDYTTTSGTLNWAAGDKTTHSFSIPIVNDTIHEPDESFTVVLSNPGGGAVLSTPSVQAVTITNDDALNGFLALAAASTTVTEGAQAVLQVTRTGGSGGPVQVDYSTSNGDAVAPDDYTTASGTLSWADGDTAPKSIIVNTVDDATDERPETFYVSLTNPQGGAALGLLQASVSITDNDTGPTGTLAMSSPTISIPENVGVLNVSVTRTGGFSGPASVNFTTQDFTALAGSDYVAQSGTLNWIDGDDAPKVISLTITDDTVDEPDEDFRVVLSGATGAALNGAATTTTITLLDNDLPLVPGVLAVSGPATVDENAATVTFFVSRTGGADGVVGVSYATVAGTATSNVDYTATSGTLAWANGDLAAKSVSVPIIDDAIDEPYETFALTLSSPTGGATLGTSSASTTIIDNDVAGPGTLGIVANVQVFETVGNAVVSVQRTGGFDGAVSVNYATASASATDGQDFTGVSGTLNWAAGDAGVKFITIPILNDSAPEALENFTVTLSGAGGGATIGAGTGFVSIQDDDVPGTLAFTQVAQTVSETAGSVTFSVSRTDGSKGAVSVDYATAAGSATAGSDYTSKSGTLNWADGDTSNKTLTVTILDDAIVENDETFTITLSGAGGGASIGTASTATVTIQSDEVPVPGTVRMVTSTVTVGEAAGQAVVSVERVGGSDGAVAIDYATIAGTATAGSDYTSTSGTLNWADGDTANKTITVPITNDTAYEADETFAVTLSNPQGGAILSNPSATVTIQSDDAPVPGALGFAATSVVVNETDGTATLSVTRTGGTDGAVSVAYATAYGTATAGDFTAKSGTLNWADGDATAKNITVSITNDTLYEPDEAFTVTLSSATGGATLGAAAATVTITSDDPPLRGTLAMASATALVNENAGTVTISVNRSGGSDGAVGVSWATTVGTATAADFTPDSGTLSWADGDAAAKTFTVAITDDAVYEPDETFTVTLSSATGGATLGAATTTVTIRSDEAPVSGTIRMAATVASVDETAGSVTLTVERFGGSDNAVGVSYATATGTAGAGDFSATSGTLSWAHGDTASKTITVPITNDTAFEADETFAVTLSNVTGGAALGTPTTTVTIVSEDPPQPGTLAMTAATASVAENLGTITLAVSRTGGADGAVSVAYATATGTAGAGDFTATSGTLNWADGDAASKSIVVPITNDTTYEPDETFTVTLSGATGGATLGAATTTVTIVSEDAPQPGTLALTATSATVNEAAGTVTISVVRNGGTDGAVGVNYATTAGTASSADFSAASGTLSWANGESGTKSFSVGITNDVLVENDEAFAVTLSNPSGGAGLGAASATVTISDDDILLVPGTIGLTQSVATVSETAGTLTLQVTRSGGLAGTVGVNYATANGTAIAGNDFTAATGTLTWGPGEGGAKSIVVSLINDTTMESDETFTVNLSNVTGGAVLGTATATVTVQSEDDTLPDAFSFNDQTGLPINAEVTSNEIVVSGINAPASIAVTGGEYSVDGAAFTSAPGTVVNGARVALRVTASNSYSTTVSAVLDIGGVSDSFSVTTKPPTVATVVKAKSGGGSFDGWAALILGALVLVRRRRLVAAPVAALLLGCVALAPAARAADSGVYVGAGGGVGDVNVSASDIERKLEEATGQTVTEVKLDDNSTAYFVRAGYQWNPFVAVEAGYYDFGSLEAEVSASVLDPEEFAQTLVRVFPNNLHGPSIMAVVSWPYSDKLALQLGVGAIAWRTDVDATVVVGGTGTYHASESATNLMWSGRMLYRPTPQLDLTLEFNQVEVEPSVHAIQLGVGWRTGWLSR